MLGLSYVEQTTLTLCITAIAVLGLYVMFVAGQFSLAQGAMMASGAYTSALLSTKASFGLPAASAASFVVGALIGAVVGALLALRLRELYLAIGTLAFNSAILVVANNTSYLGESSGIVGVPLDTDLTTAAIALAVVVVLVYLVGRSRLGQAFRAIGEDEKMASAVGINVPTTKIMAMAIGSGLAAVAGSLYVFNVGYATPSEYGSARSILLWVPLILGGTAYLVGPLLGSVIVVFLPSLLSTAWSIDSNFILGGLLIVTMLLRANGIFAAGDPAAIYRRLNLRRSSPQPERPLTDGYAPPSSPPDREASLVPNARPNLDDLTPETQEDR